MIWSLWCEEKPTFCHHWNCRDFLIPLKGYLLTLNIILTRQSIRFTAMVTFGKYNYYFSKWVSISSNQTKRLRTTQCKHKVIFGAVLYNFSRIFTCLGKFDQELNKANAKVVFCSCFFTQQPLICFCNFFMFFFF